MGQTTSSVELEVKSQETVTYLVLNGESYTALVYTGDLWIVTDGHATNILKTDVKLIDIRSVTAINMALSDVVQYYKADPNGLASITTTFEAIVAAFGPVSPCNTKEVWPYPIQCSSLNMPDGRSVHFGMYFLGINPSEQPDDCVPNCKWQTHGSAVNTSYVFALDRSSNTFNFFVPDYFVQAQNPTVLDSKTNWSYLPNFDLALHTPTSLLEKKKCKCKREYRHKCKCKCKEDNNKPYTTPTALHSMLAKIYNIAHLVETGALDPTIGETQIVAIWNSMKIYEVNDPENLKTVQINGQTGLVTMVVRYRLLNSEMMVAMSISGTYLNGLYFNVSTIPVGSDSGSNSKHAYNKGISQYVHYYVLPPTN